MRVRRAVKTMTYFLSISQHSSTSALMNPARYIAALGHSATTTTAIATINHAVVTARHRYTHHSCSPIENRVSKNGTRVHGLSIRRVFTSATSIHGSVSCVPTEVSGNAVMPSHSHEVIPVPINIKFHSGPVRILSPVTSGNSRKSLSSTVYPVTDPWCPWVSRHPPFCLGALF